ncbi:MAG TPA: CoA transferase [Dehalococcoidales bacterium]|nr:CoA transferase [Dehalococcoidales bacterium]
MSNPVNGTKPFEGIKVLQLCWAGVGVFTLNFLSFYGAQTIRVESSLFPDPVRLFEPFAPTCRPGEEIGLERSAFYAITHPAPEMNLQLNLKTAEGVAIFKELVKWADVVGEGFPAGVMDKIGLDYACLQKIKPEIIMMRTCGYGHTGKMSDQPGFGSIISAVSMMNTLTGYSDRPPLALTTYYTDMLAPLQAALAIIAALDYRRRTGKGSYIDQSQIESGLNYMTPLLLDYQANGRIPKLKGNQSDYHAPQGIYPCLGDDRWVALAVTNEEEWQSFIKVLGNPEWSRESKFDTMAGRIKNCDELDEMIKQWTMKRQAEEVMHTLQGAGVPAGIVSNAHDINVDPQLDWYDFNHPLDHPFMGRLNFYHPPAFKLSRADVEFRAPTLLGEHTEEICSRILGMSAAEISALREKGVFR